MTTSYTSFYELVYGRSSSPATTDTPPTKEQLEAAIKVLNEKVEELKKKEEVVFKDGCVNHANIKRARFDSGLPTYYYKDGKYYDIDTMFGTGDYRVDFDYSAPYTLQYSLYTPHGTIQVVEEEDKELSLIFVIRA